MNNKTKGIIIAGAVLAAGLACGLTAMGRNTEKPIYSTSVLEKNDLQSTISTTGIVESQNSCKVYASTPGRVETVSVKVGDQVQEGDILCQMDTSDLELTIESTRAGINQSESVAAHNIEMSEKKYEQAKENRENDLDSQVAAAHSALVNAKEAYHNAKDNYESHQPDEGAIKEARANYKAAKQALLEAQKAEQPFAEDYEAAQQATLTAAADLEKALGELEQAQQAEVPNPEEIALKQQEFSRAQAAYDLAKADEAAKKMALDPLHQLTLSKEISLHQAETIFDSFYADDEMLAQLEKAVDSAETAYENAKHQLRIAENNSDQALESMADQIDTAKLSNNTQAQRTELKRLTKQLNDSAIKSPINGTVTAVYATEGSSGSGLLFVVEDLEDLKVSAKIREYDISLVDTGMKTEIRSDGTGDEVSEGTLTEIAPVAIKNPDGSVNTSGNAEFLSEISVDSKDTNLKVGMNARVNIITQSQKQVFGVPYDSIVIQPDGSSVIYAVTEEEGRSIVHSIPVTTGIETDFFMEVSGKDLADGLMFIVNPEGLTDGQDITGLITER